MSTARIPGTDVTGLYGTMVKKFSERKLGRVPNSIGVMWHNRPVLKAMFEFGGKADKWDACDRQLKAFAHMATVSLVGCTFCLDFGYLQAANEHLDLEKVREVPRWRESDLFSPLEREVMAYAEAMSMTPPAVTDAMSASLLDQLGPAGLLELSAVIGAANLTSRTNVALGIEAEGFATAAGLPPLAVRPEPSLVNSVG
jgi:alkylhydroperoxidase family enzyme